MEEVLKKARENNIKFNPKKKYNLSGKKLSFLVLSLEVNEWSQTRIE